MFQQLFFINMICFLSMKTTLLDMTINNPIFIFSLITVIWFIPGLLVKRFNEIKKSNLKQKSQAEAINKLYPKNKD